MEVPTHATAFEVLCLQAADDGRGDVLFGDSFERVREFAPPLIVGKGFPSTYLEFPLVGDPFLDVTILYDELEPGTRVDSDAVEGTEAVFDWFSPVREEKPEVTFGFELDTKTVPLPKAAIHFQPRKNWDLVKPFCEIVGEPERADLYLGLAARMPEGWPLSFFGMFRGRPQSPLRVCGYLNDKAVDDCAGNPSQLAAVFDAVGFTAYDDGMLDQATTMLSAAPRAFDFQFDIYPDGTIGDTFALDVQFNIEQPEAIRESFEAGVVSSVMSTLEEWGAADARWKVAADMAFARALPVELDDGQMGRYSFTLMPQWAKVRWRNGVLQPSKLYLLGKAGLLEN